MIRAGRRRGVPGAVASSTARCRRCSSCSAPRVRRRARRGVHAAPAGRHDASWCSPLGGLVAALRRGRRAGRRPRSRRRRGRGRGRRPDAVPAGHHPAALARWRARRRRALARHRRRRVRPAGVVAAGLASTSGRSRPPGSTQTEVFPLTLFAVGGMLLFPAANDLLTMFVALEVLSLPLYLLCGLARRRRLLSQEAALKYFLLGAFSSAFFLYGVALLYGYAGTVDLAGHRRRPSAPTPGTRRAAADRHRAARGRPAVQGRRRAVPLVDAGRLPGRARRRSPGSWPPAPRSPRSARCCGSSTSRSAASRWDWRPMLWVVAILTMLVGSVVALTQTDVKRMLAYSSIAHAGFILVGVRRRLDRRRASSSVLFYLLAYGFIDDRRVRRRHPGARLRRRGDAPVAVGRARPSARRWSPACSRSSCWPSRASRSPAASPGSSPSSRPRVDGGAAPLVVVGVLCERDRGVLLRPGRSC